MLELSRSVHPTHKSPNLPLSQAGQCWMQHISLSSPYLRLHEIIYLSLYFSRGTEKEIKKKKKGNEWVKVSKYLVSLTPLWGRDMFLVCTGEVSSPTGFVSQHYCKAKEHHYKHLCGTINIYCELTVSHPNVGQGQINPTAAELG